MSSTLLSTERVTNVFVSKYPHWLKVDFGLEFHSGSHQTIDHTEVTEWVTFSAMGEMAYILGQMLDELIAVSHPRSPWTIADVRSLHGIWERWHLNDMRAGCAHLEYQYETDPTHGYQRLKLDGEGTVCPVSGYKMGRSTLVEPLPDMVITEVRRLLAIAREMW